MTNMRAKLRLGSVIPLPDGAGGVAQERLSFHGVAASSYPADGSDENNTFAKFSPSAVFEIVVANPALIGEFTPGDTFYVDFTPVA
ncbi:hypothetical protein [Phenylobacterium ferrooxidans]|uniref:Uncharacterized protein n=1 Tax=Phenylobacterium ferrooxidans TaxID=2982689 RepID=A0ABW6CMQ3_9CAUL